MEKVLQFIESIPIFSSIFLAVKSIDGTYLYVNKTNAEFVITYQDKRRKKKKYSGFITDSYYKEFRKYIIYITRNNVLTFIDGYITSEARDYFKNNMFNISVEPEIGSFYDVYKCFLH